MFTTMGLAFGVVGVGVGSAVNEMPWWCALLISVIPTIIGVVWDIIRYQGLKRGWFDKSTADKIEGAVDHTIADLKDDGKLNNSNKNKE